MQRNTVTGDASSTFLVLIVITILTALIAILYDLSRERQQYDKHRKTWQQNCKDKSGVSFISGYDRICFSKSIIIEIQDETNN